jgi:hypothetical protein
MDPRWADSIVDGDRLCDLLEDFTLGVENRQRLVENIDVVTSFFDEGDSPPATGTEARAMIVVARPDHPAAKPLTGPLGSARYRSRSRHHLRSRKAETH